MKTGPRTQNRPIIDPQMKEEIQLAESRKIAKDMACRRECGENEDGSPKKEHVSTCPYWDIMK